MKAAAKRAGRLWGRLQGNGPALFGLVLVALLASIALLAPVLPLADPYATALEQRFLPALYPGHLLGTDQLGRDLLSRLVWGTRSSLVVGLSATAAAAVVGTLVGMISGYLGRWADTLLMRGVDVLMGFPYLLLALAIVAALGPGLRNAMIAIVVVNVPFFARTVRGAVLALKDRPFIEAARLLGFSPPRILAVEILPNVMPAIVIMMGTTLGWMVLETAGLSFLGLGAQPPAADLGSMLGESREFLTTVPRVALLPGLVILLLVIGINLLGDGLRDVLDPHQPGVGSEARDRSSEKARGDVSPVSPQALLQVRGLGIAFATGQGAQRVVDELGLELAAGERLALVGESGSGKTQSALALLGLVPPPGRVTAGSIRFRGEELAGADEAHWRELRGKAIAYVPQDPMTALDPLFTVGEQLIETLRLGSRHSRSRLRSQAAELLARVQLSEPHKVLETYPHELSGGMRQRVMIALGIAHGPEVLIADEATTALDVTIQAEILELLDGLCAERRMSLIFITHDLALVGQICDRILVLYAGRPVEDLGVGRLFAGAAHPYTRALLACTPVLGQPDKPLQPIPGVPPAADALPTGCLFAPRCAYAEPACTMEPIALRALRGDQHVRCRRAEELMA
jgi:peptide/nickel transport system permease protein